MNKNTYLYALKIISINKSKEPYTLTPRLIERQKLLFETGWLVSLGYIILKRVAPQYLPLESEMCWVSLYKLNEKFCSQYSKVLSLLERL